MISQMGYYLWGSQNRRTHFSMDGFAACFACQEVPAHIQLRSRSHFPTFAAFYLQMKLAVGSMNKGVRFVV